VPGLKLRTRPEPAYVSLTWDGDGVPAAHYVTGHVTADEFRAAIERWFGENSRNKPVIPQGVKLEHVYIRRVRIENDDYGNRQTQFRHCAQSSTPMTYYEIVPNKGPGE
jgi:hypothetical protein